jgi:hypothetical protein
VTARDRLVIILLVVGGALAAMWFMVVAPERNQAQHLGSELATAKQALASAQQTEQQAEAAKAAYPSAYAALVRLGEAVPADAQEPSLIYQLDQAANTRHVAFEALAASTASPSAAPTPAPTPATPSATGTTASSAAGTTAGGAAAVAAPTLTPMPFSLTFDGGFFSLYQFLQNVNGFTTVNPNGTLTVKGRLLTVQGLTLQPKTPGPGLVATVNATAYVMPATQATTASGTTPAPGGVTPTSTSAPAPSPVPATAVAP